MREKNKYLKIQYRNKRNKLYRELLNDLFYKKCLSSWVNDVGVRKYITHKKVRIKKRLNRQMKRYNKNLMRKEKYDDINNKKLAMHYFLW